MSTIVVQAFVTLDGVVQAGGGPDEDPEGAFPHGGWASQHDAQEDVRGQIGQIVSAWESATEALLLGRRTYEIFARSWGVWDEDAPGLEGELTRRYNRIPKYVASRTLTRPQWQQSHVLGEDLPRAVAALRTQGNGEIRVWGSTELVATLAKHDLIDEYRLVQYPLVLGTGKRLFREGFPLSRFDLTETRALSCSVVVNTYSRRR